MNLLLSELKRSGCPINLTLEALGDRWSLIVIRDVMFGDRRYFRELLAKSEEEISSSVLADRLKRLLSAGLITRTPALGHKQKSLYCLAEPAIQLLPLLAQMGAWGVRHTSAGFELSVRAQVLEAGGPDLWSRLMEELRDYHIKNPMPAPPPERGSARSEFEETVARVLKRGGTSSKKKRS